MTNRTVLILGAQGRFGREATSAFAAAGWRVRAWARRPDARWPEGVAGVQNDALDTAAVARAALGASVIVNALNPPYTQWERLARPLAASALAAAEAHGALLLFPGNVYNFGKELPPLLGAATPQIPDTAKARIRIDIERQLRDAARRGIDSVVVRAGDYFGGSGRGSWFDLVIAKALAKGKMVYPGPADRLHAWAYLPDLAQAFVQLAERREQLRGAQCFHFGGHAFSGAELHRALENVTGQSLRLGSLPWGAIRLIAPFSPMLKAALEMRYLWQRPHALDGAPLRDLLGSVPHTDLHRALSATLTGLGLASAAPAHEPAARHRP